MSNRWLTQKLDAQIADALRRAGAYGSVTLTVEDGCLVGLSYKHDKVVTRESGGGGMYVTEVVPIKDWPVRSTETPPVAEKARDEAEKAREEVA